MGLEWGGSGEAGDRGDDGSVGFPGVLGRLRGGRSEFDDE